MKTENQQLSVYLNKLHGKCNLNQVIAIKRLLKQNKVRHLEYKTKY